MDIRQGRGNMSEATLKEHLKEALDESDPAEKDYHIRSALQYMTPDDANSSNMNSDD